MILDTAVRVPRFSSLHQKACVICPATFTVSSPNQKCCPACRPELRRRVNTEWNRKKYGRTAVDLTVQLPRGPHNGGVKLGGQLHELELQTLHWLELGKDHETVAELMGVKRETVSTRLGRIMTKLGVATSTAAVAKAIRKGLI